MRILLCQATSYYPSSGGAPKSNRLLLEALTRKGHRCAVIAKDLLSGYSRGEFRAALANEGVEITSEVPAIDCFELNGVAVSTVWENPGWRHLWRQIRKFDPTWV